MMNKAKVEEPGFEKEGSDPRDPATGLRRISSILPRSTPILSYSEMKGTCSLMASVVAASTVALSSSSSSSSTSDHTASNSCTDQGKSMKSRAASLEKGKFSPKFDGLRFIETLVTAHR